MFTCSRSVIKNMPRKIRATTNPYGVGHNWVQARYQLYNWPIPGKILGPLIVDAKDEKGNSEPPRRAVHGFLQENVIMMHTDPEYINRIKAGARNESELNAWLYGSWDIAAGGMFDDIWYNHKDTIVVPDFDVPFSWRIMRAYDHGSSKPWSCGWYAESDGTDLDRVSGRQVESALDRARRPVPRRRSVRLAEPTAERRLARSCRRYQAQDHRVRSRARLARHTGAEVPRAARPGRHRSSTT
jgi:hypothetical protein